MTTPKPSNSVRRRLLATGAVIACATAAAGLIVGPGTAHLSADPVRSGLMAAATLAFVGPEQAKLTPAEAIRVARNAVFMIGTLDTHGGFDQIGTGFAVRDGADGGLVATAAHVAERAAAARKEGVRVVVRRPEAGAPTDIEVTSEPVIHPGFLRWRTLNERQLVARTTGGYEHVSSMIPADVAVLPTSPGLGSALDLAREDQLATLGSGDVVVYLGFPSENIYGQKTNVPPTAGFGHIQALSGIMFEPTAPEASLVVQHDILLTGGSSGGPILIADDATGRLAVIGAHTAASHVFLADGRVPLAKGYAQRADLIRELVNGTAASAQDGRDEAWAGAVRSVTLSAGGRLDALREALSERFAITELDRFSVELKPSTPDSTARTFRVEEGASYTFIATADNWDDVNLALSQAGTELSSDTKPDAIPVVNWTASFTGEVELSITAATTYGRSTAEVRVLKVTRH